MKDFSYSVECQVNKEFAWKFWSDVNNWAVVDPAVEFVRLDGPFASGAKGTTKPRGLGPTEWSLIEVQEGESAVIEIAAAGAVVRFAWRFEETTSGGTRMTQQVSLEGERAEDYKEAMESLEKHMPAGMQKLCEAMQQAGGSAS